MKEKIIRENFSGVKNTNFLVFSQNEILKILFRKVFHRFFVADPLALEFIEQTTFKH